MQEVVYKQYFNVDYHELNDNLWRVIASMNDIKHEIVLELYISLPNLVIKEANINFLKYPLWGCLVNQNQIKELIGSTISDNYFSKITKMFAGSSGCPNVLHLLRISGQAIWDAYFPNKSEISKKEWKNFGGTKLSNECIAQRLLFEKKRMKNSKKEYIISDNPKGNG